jgi:hypothetical protein
MRFIFGENEIFGPYFVHLQPKVVAMLLLFYFEFKRPGFESQNRYCWSCVKRLAVFLGSSNKTSRLFYKADHYRFFQCYFQPSDRTFNGTYV